MHPKSAVNKERTCLISVVTVYMVVVAVMSYFDYHIGFGAAVAGLLLATVLLPTVLLSIIPFAGTFIQAAVSLKLIEWWSHVTGLPANMLTVAVAFWPAVLAGSAICFASTLLLLIRL
jgi:hypothetical protein